jgi:transaldolase
LGDAYFSRVRVETGFRFWVNNPTRIEIDLALGHDTMGCTTNPAYVGSLLRREPDDVRAMVRSCLTASGDDAVVADLVQQRLVERIAMAFMPLYERTGGREGFVSIQGSPDADTDGNVILCEAREACALAPNVTPKLPATAPGLEAFEALVADGSPVIVTEVFSLAQLREVCERWLAVTTRTGARPPLFVSPITGILGDHLRRVAIRDGLAVPAAAIEMAGVVLARACHDMVRERDYPAVLLFGGARRPVDFTGLVGDGMAGTINWSMAAELLAADLPASRTIGNSVDPDLVRMLTETFADMRAALDPDRLDPSDFESFPPVQHFRGSFLESWRGVLDLIAACRHDVEPPSP